MEQRPPSPDNQSLAGSGYHSNSASSDSIATSIFTSNDSLYGAAGHAMDRRREVSEATITIDDYRLDHSAADIPAARPAISEAEATITDSPVITITKLSLPEPIPPLVRAPLVRIAVDALLADCAGPAACDNPGTAMAVPERVAGSLSEDSELCLLGSRVQRAIFDQAPGWHERAASEIANAAARLASGTTRNAIDFNFVQLSLAAVIGDYATRHGPYRAYGDNGLLPSPILAQSDTLDRIRQLRDVDSANRRKLDVALDGALGAQADPGIRRVAQRIVEMVAEMANESFRRRVYNDEIEKLLTTAVGNIEALHRAFTGLYALDRYFASAYQSGVNRCLTLIESLPGPVQEDFARTFTAAQKGTGDDTAAQGLRAYRDKLESGAVLPGRVTKRLQADQQRLMTDLFSAAALLRGEQPAAGQADDIATATRRAALQAMPPAPRRTLRDIAQGLWRRIRPSTPLERAQRRIVQAIKQQAASISPTRAQWKALEAAVQDVVRLQRPLAQYGDVVQACVSTLTPAQCVALHDLVDSYEFLKADAPNAGDRLPAGRKRHLLALDAALAKEPAVRRSMQAVRNAVDALRGGNDHLGFVDAIEALAACLDRHAADLPDARILCELTLKRLALPSDHLSKALAPLKSLQAQVRLEDSIKASATWTVSHRRLEAIVLVPALRALEAALEHQVA